MLRSHNHLKHIIAFGAKSALFLVLFVLNGGEPVFASQVRHGLRSLRDWPCVKSKHFLRDSRGNPVWLTSSQLVERAINRQSPERPALLGKNSLHGEVTVQVLIGKDGRIECVRGVRGNPLAISSAVYSTPKWTFKPYLVDGEPRSVLGLLTVSYDFR